ncbi:MAG TPA: SUMF1/EgtB/PvdO family nonheme iron enzyme [Candidatus Cloacimonadota bacterium]|nr:SUMF1/EgtB/PvdO family nonheme iron enzyme [Candidatus Cloacimonadota bacterium]
MKTLKYLALLLLVLPLLFSCEDNNNTEVNQVANPVFSPEPGTYATQQTVSITCATEGAVIRYTTNGANPDSLSLIYRNPILVESDMTIKAIAMKDGMDDSEVVTGVYVIQYDKMILVPSGTFTMGRTTGDGDDDELPAHNVTLSSFVIGKYEVTQAEWFSVMGNNPSHFTGDTSRPVEMVSWYAALVYCNKRSIAEGLTPVYTIGNSTNPGDWGAIPTTNNATWNSVTCNWTANGYRLPTEAEWEYAARGATNNPDYLYAGSNTIGDVGWYDANSGNTTHPVGLKAPNGLGIYDMTGNVREWCWDWYNATYYSSSPTNNPHGPISGTVHTIRGGAWSNQPPSCRVVFRNWGTPEKDSPKVFNEMLGLRVVRLAD